MKWRGSPISFHMAVWVFPFTLRERGIGNRKQTPRFHKMFVNASTAHIRQTADNRREGIYHLISDDERQQPYRRFEVQYTAQFSQPQMLGYSSEVGLCGIQP